MIYLFDKNKKLNKALSLNHFNSAHQVKIINGSYTVDLVTPLKFTKRGTVYNHKKAFDKAVFVGHFDENDEFQLYKIRNISVDNNSLNIIGIHIFFDEAKAKTIIHDRRWRDSELRPIADFALGEIGWNLIECDVTDRYNFNIFRGSVLDFRNDAVDTYKVEMDYVIGFDGQQITSKGVRIKKRLGEETGQRFAYGSNVLKIKAEEERSEVYSAILGRGRGEESGDGFGQRIEFGDVVWSTANGDPVNKPVGQNYVELTSATDKYGYHEADGTVHPRIAVIEFDDIEDTGLLIQESWEWLLQNSVPKAVFESEVFALGNFKLGDSIGIIYKDAGIVKKARVHKVDRNLHDNRKTSFELGDYKHFKPNSINDVRKELKKQKRSTSEWITRLKTMFDADFEQVVGEINDSYANAVAESEAKVQASEAKMNEVISGQRDALEQEINTAKQSAIDEATLNAETKAQTVQSNLDTFKGTHQQLYDSVSTDIMDIDQFLGDIRNITLDDRLQEMNLDFEDRIQNININTANMLQGTRFDEPDKINTSIGGVAIKTSEDIAFIRIQDDTGYVSRFAFEEPVKLEADTDYFVVIEYRTFTVPEIDYFAIETPSGYVRLYSPDTGEEGFTNLVTDGVWNQATIRLNEPVMLQGKLHIGTRPSGENGVWIDIRQPYMTNTSNRRWLPHPNDATQSIEQITRRITELEDGREELITRSEYDFDTGQVDQTIRDIEEKVDISRNMIIDIENYEVIKNGSEVLQAVDLVDSKVWMNDVANIGANMIPQSVEAWTDGRYWSTGTSNGTSENMRLKRDQSIVVGAGVTVTFADYSPYNSAISHWLINFTDWSGETPYGEQLTVSRGGALTFTTPIGSTRVLLSAIAIDGTTVQQSRIEEPGKRIFVKMEVGNTATPIMSAISHVEQIADAVSIRVQELDGEYLSQSDLQITADYWQLGSKRVDGNTVASVLRGTPDSIDAIVDEMNLTGNLNVKGQIETISLDAIDANFGRVQTAILKADVIENMHLSSNSVEVDNIRMTHALAEKIMANTVMANEVKAMSVNAVYADLRSVNSEIMTSNIIKSNWLDVDTALFNRFTASSAFISSLTAKTAFIRDIQAIEINTSQLNVDTIMEQGGNIAGGISIRRPDGAYAVNNGMLKNEYVVNAYNPNFMTATSQGLNAFYQSGEWWVTSRRVRQDAGRLRFNAYQFVHSARYLEIEVGYRRHQTDVFFEINSFGSYSFNQTYSQFQGGGGSTEYHVMKVDLGVPDYRRKSFYFYAYPNSSGDEADQMWFRILRVVQTDF